MTIVLPSPEFFESAIKSQAAFQIHHVTRMDEVGHGGKGTTLKWTGHTATLLDGARQS